MKRRRHGRRQLLAGDQPRDRRQIGSRCAAGRLATNPRVRLELILGDAGRITAIVAAQVTATLESAQLQSGRGCGVAPRTEISISGAAELAEQIPGGPAERQVFWSAGSASGVSGKHQTPTGVAKGRWRMPHTQPGFLCVR
jgi:hypothetical protein